MNETQTRRLALAVYEGRSARGWSQDRLAKEARIAPNTVIRIECGRPVRSGSVAKVMSALGLGPELMIESDLIGLLATKDAEIERLQGELSWAATAKSLAEWQERWRQAEDRCGELLASLLTTEQERDLMRRRGEQWKEQAESTVVRMDLVKELATKDAEIKRLQQELIARPERTTWQQDASDEGYRLQVAHAESQRDAALAKIRTYLEARGRLCNVCTGHSPSWAGHDRNPPCETQALADLQAVLGE